MKLMRIFLVVIVAGMIFACGGAEKRAYESQEAVNKERLELIDKYEKCMKKAKEDKDKAADCEQYLKAAEALKN